MTEYLPAMNAIQVEGMSSAKPVIKKAKRSNRGPLFIMGLGAMLVVGHNFVQDYAQALVSPDGLYIPEARFVIPSGTPAGPYTHTFHIYNVRPQSVAVEAAADCGCTGLSWTKTWLPPLGWKSLSVIVRKKKLPQSLSSNIVFQFGNDKKSTLVASISIPKS